MHLFLKSVSTSKVPQFDLLSGFNVKVESKDLFRKKVMGLKTIIRKGSLQDKAAHSNSRLARVIATLQVVKQGEKQAV